MQTTNSGKILKCYTCREEFSDRDVLRHHIREVHGTYKPCRKFQNDRCDNDEDECDFNHIVLEQGKHICYKCGQIEGSKTNLLKHVTKKHGDIPCHKFQTNQCDFGSERCLFSHKVSTPTSQQGFQEPPQRNAPPEVNIVLPIVPHQKGLTNQDIMTMMTEMQMNLNIIQKQIMRQY